MCFVWLCFQNDLFQHIYFAYIDTLCFQYESLLLRGLYFTSTKKSCGHIDVNEMSVQCLKTAWPCNTIQNVDQTLSFEDYKAVSENQGMKATWQGHALIEVVTKNQVLIFFFNALAAADL